MLPQTGLPLVVRKKTNGSPHLPARNVWLGMCRPGEGPTQPSQQRAQQYFFNIFFLTPGKMPKKHLHFADLFDPFLILFGVNAGVFATKEKDKERDDASEI